MTQNNKKKVSRVIRIIGVQPTSFNLPKEVLRPRAPIEIKMNNLEISPIALETSVGIAPPTFNPAKTMNQIKNEGMFLYQGLAASSAYLCFLEAKRNMKMMSIGIIIATLSILVMLAISKQSGPIMAPAPTT